MGRSQKRSRLVGRGTRRQSRTDDRLEHSPLPRRIVLIYGKINIPVNRCWKNTNFFKDKYHIQKTKSTISIEFEDDETIFYDDKQRLYHWDYQNFTITVILKCNRFNLTYEPISILCIQINIR